MDMDNPGLTRESKLVLGTLVLAATVMLLNETTLSVALPVIMDSFGVTAATAQWLTTGFMLTMAVVIPTTGFIIERLTTSQVFITAFVFFLGGTLVAALAPVFLALLGGRVLQAAGTALIMPLLMTTVMNVVPPSMRGSFVGMMSVVISLAPAFGPTVSGFILNYFSWHFVFWFMVPFVVFILLVGVKYISNVGESTEKPFDIISVPLAAIGFGGLVYALSDIETLMAGSFVPIIVGVAAIIALIAFVLRQLSLGKRDQAFLDLRVFAVPGFAIAIILIMVIFGLLLGLVTVLPIYLQKALLVTTAVSGLVVMPGGLLQVGVRPLMIPGIIVLAISTGLLAWAAYQRFGPIAMAMLYVLFEVGIAFGITPLYTASLSSLPAHLYSHGSATLSTAQQLASAIGVAILVAVLTQQTNSKVAAGAPLVDATAHGATSAFLVATILAVVAVLLSFFIKQAKN